MNVRIDEILKSRKFNLCNSIIISSDTRSGSTWLMELLYSVTNSFINWEPLHPNFGIVPSAFKWGDDPHLPEDDTNTAFKDLMRQCLILMQYSPWTLKYANINDGINADRVLTKFVRANLLLPWLVNNFEFHHPPIYLIRHPVPVAMSQFKAFHEQKTALKEGFVIPDWINNERFITEFDFISKLQTPLEKKIALWCLNNMTTLKHPKNGQSWINVYYEDLVLYPEREFNRILKAINLEVSKELLATVDFRDASVTDFKGDLQSPKEQLNKWKHNFSEAELHNIQQIFEHFQLKTYSAFEVLPIAR